MDKTDNSFSETRPFTAVFRGLTTDEASDIVNHPKWSAGSWSHALDDRDSARAAQAASQPKALTDDLLVQLFYARKATSHSFESRLARF